MAGKKEETDPRRDRTRRMQTPGQTDSDASRQNDAEHQRARCLSDIEQFYANVKEVKRTAENAHILDLAAQYCEDTKYFLEKKDYVTAFGAINYAHGLIDAFRKAKGEK